MKSIKAFPNFLAIWHGIAESERERDRDKPMWKYKCQHFWKSYCSSMKPATLFLSVFICDMHCNFALYHRAITASLDHIFRINPFLCCLLFKNSLALHVNILYPNINQCKKISFYFSTQDILITRYMIEIFEFP